MRHMKSSLMAAACLAAGTLAAPASAATVVESYEFSATYPDVGVFPILDHSGSFSFSYDDADPTVLTLLNIDFVLNGVVYDLTNAGIDGSLNGWTLGGTVGGVRSLSPGATDFVLDYVPGSPFYAYTLDTAVGSFSNGEPTITRIDTAVPEPSTWAMLLLGFFAAGHALRSARRRQKLTVTYA